MLTSSAAPVPLQQPLGGEGFAAIVRDRERQRQEADGARQSRLTEFGRPLGGGLADLAADRTRQTHEAQGDLGAKLARMRGVGRTVDRYA